MKLKLKKEALKVLTDRETRLVGGGETESCGCTPGNPECGTTDTQTMADCTNYVCPTSQSDCTYTANC